MIGTEITITNVLAQQVGELAKRNPNSAVHILWSDAYDEREWLVKFGDGDYPVTFIVDDELGTFRIKDDGVEP